MTADRRYLEDEVQRLAAIQPWWHDIELPYGVRTVGRRTEELDDNYDEVKWGRMRPLLDLAGRSVLDIGCNEGYYLVQSLAAGARATTGVDIDPLRIEKAEFVIRSLSLDRAKVTAGDALHVDEVVEDHFDICFCLGLLHRVTDPYVLLQKIASLADLLVIEWPALPEASAAAAYWGGAYKHEQSFYNTGFWQLSRRCLADILSRLGDFHMVDATPYGRRAMVLASQDRGTIAEIQSKVPPAGLGARLAYKRREWRYSLRSLYLSLFGPRHRG